MPYTEQSSRKAIETGGLEAVKTVGDLNYILTVVILNMWAASPKYATIHALRKELVIDPKRSRYLQQLRTDLSDRFDTADIYAAAAEAFHEFRERIGRLYEALKCRENTDIPGYPEAINEIMLKLENKSKQEAANQIIIPDGIKK